MDDDEYLSCDVEKCEYWDRDIEFCSIDELNTAEMCEECNQQCTKHDGTDNKWCQPCNSKHFKNDFDKWTSGNIDIDKFIQKIQLAADSQNKVIEWIPYHRLKYTKEIVRSGFEPAYSAFWLDGKISDWNAEQQRWNHLGCQRVELKYLNNSIDPTFGFLKEVESSVQIAANPFFIQCLGISQDAQT